MAEAYTIRMGDIPSRSLRKRVRGFLEDGDVSLLDDVGRRFGVALRKNKLVIERD
jgi:hypothetical protein